MLEIRRDEQNPKRRFRVGRVPTLEGVQSALDSVSANYCLFLAVNATSINDDSLRKAAKAFKTTFEVFTRVGPDNSLERLTERSVGLVTDRPSNVYELLVTLFE